jgi:hypothetical protein
MRSNSGGSLRSVSVILYALAVATFSFFGSVPNASAVCSCSCAANTSWNYGPVESRASASQVFGFQLYNCATGITGFTVTGSDKQDIISITNTPGHQGCIGFNWLSGFQPAACYVTIQFSPQGTGARDATIAPDATGDSYTPPAVNSYGAGFTLTPERHDVSGSPTTTSGMCTGQGAPYSCCTGAGTGTCVDAFRLAYESGTLQGFGYITFDPGNADITWNGTLDYQTSGNLPKQAAKIDKSGIKKFTTKAKPYTIGIGPVPNPPPGPPPERTYADIFGGQLQLKATYDKSGVGQVTNMTTAYVTGFPSSQSSPGIPYATISTELTDLYQTVSAPSGANFTPVTPGLMTQIAQVENKGQQFSAPPNLNSLDYPYDVVDYWPSEGGAAGLHIGLMQVFVNGPNAWDWIQNAKNAIVCPPGVKKCSKLSLADGAASFQEKLSLAYTNMKMMQTGLVNQDLSPFPALNSCQLEEMAVALYGDSPGGTVPNEQYYTPTCNGNPAVYPVPAGGSQCSSPFDWQWTVNTFTNITTKAYCGVCYVAMVRTSSLGGSGEPTSCSATDPPTMTLTDCGPAPKNNCPTKFVPLP